MIAPAASPRDRVAHLRTGVAEAAVRHPRHVLLSCAVVGLLGGGRLSAPLVAALALLAAACAPAVPLVRRPAGAVLLAVVVLGGAWIAEARTSALDATQFAPQIGREVAGEATILAPPRADPFGGLRALVRFRDEPVLLRVPRWWVEREGVAAGAALRVGDVVAARGRLRAPDLAARAVHAHATLRATDVTATGRRRGGLLGVIDGVRRRAEGALGGHLPTAEASLLRGMVLGDDADMPDELHDAFTAASLSHLTAASGQNVALLAALALGLGAVAGLGIRARWALVLTLIIIYVPLAGGGASIQRAGVMGAATIAAALAGRPASRGYALLLAAAATLALDPRSAGDVGWQLSFAAVAGIGVIAGPARTRLRARGIPRAAAEAIAVTLAATIATAPLIALHFGQSSLVGLPANVLAAPAVAPIMWLGMAAAAMAQVAPPLAEPLVALAGPLLGYLTGLARLASNLPAAQLPLPAATVTILSGLAAVLATAPRATPEHGRLVAGRRLRRLLPALAVLIAVVAAIGPAVVPPPSVPPPPDGTFRITALDVGQGDATLLQAGGHAVLVDAGPPGDGIVGALGRAGVTRLDALAVTHPQADHDGGAPAVLAGLRVDLLLDGRGGDRSPTSTAIDAPLARNGTRRVPARAGQSLRAGPLTLRILWPPPTPAAPGTDPNDRAIVALASAYGATALLTADAESPVLAPLDLPPVDVLKVSHHGSADPGLPALLERLRPRAALIEVGAHNTYGHPNPATLQQLTTRVPIVRRTDQDGTLRVDLHAGAATVTTGRTPR